MRRTVDSSLQRQRIRLQVFAHIARECEHPSHDAQYVGQNFLDTCTSLDTLASDHPEIVTSFEMSRMCLVLQAPEPINQKLSRFTFNARAYLRELQNWLVEEPDTQHLRAEDLTLFLQTARRGRRCFQTANQDPERFLTNDTFWLTTVLKMALVNFGRLHHPAEA